MFALGTARSSGPFEAKWESVDDHIEEAPHDGTEDSDENGCFDVHSSSGSFSHFGTDIIAIV